MIPDFHLQTCKGHYKTKMLPSTSSVPSTAKNLGHLLLSSCELMTNKDFYADPRMILVELNRQWQVGGTCPWLRIKMQQHRFFIYIIFLGCLSCHFGVWFDWPFASSILNVIYKLETGFECLLIHSNFDPWTGIAQVIKYWKYYTLSWKKIDR